MAGMEDRFREAMSLHRADAVERAEAIYRDLLHEDPEHAGAWHLLGVVLHSRGDLAGALEYIQKALSLCDFKAAYWNNLGAVLKDPERQEEALDALEKAVGLRDAYPDAWSNLGLMQTELGLLDEAEKSIRYSLRLEPRHGAALRHLAVIRRERGDYEEALRLCRDAAAVASGDAEVLAVEGSILAAAKRFEEAGAAYEKALSLKPDSADAHLNRGLALANLDEIGKARESFLRAAELRPDRPVWRLRHLSLCPTVFRTSRDVVEFRAELEGQLDEALADPPPFDWRHALRDGFAPAFELSHHGVCNRSLKEKFARLFAPHFSQGRPERKWQGRIRVGFTCTQGHEGGFVRGFGGIMERLDRERHEVVGLVSEGIVPVCRKQVRADDVAWLGFPYQLERAFEVFRAAACDLVMHWHAGTDVMNYFLPMLPLAPVQCIGFGTHGTTGIANIDYFISSRLFERGADADEDYAEKLVQFDGTTAWQPRPPKPEPASRSDFGLPDAGALYFCPQRLEKFHPDFDRILRRILDQDTTGHVVLLKGNRPKAAEALRIRLTSLLGETLAGRLLFVPSQEPAAYYRLMSLMDVVLDTPVYSASLTAYDALSMGRPVVTLRGSLMVQRYARGLYTRMGVGDLIAGGEEEYVELAIRLGQDGGFRESIAGKILQRCECLYEDRRVVGEYEEFFGQVCR